MLENELLLSFFFNSTAFWVAIDHTGYFVMYLKTHTDLLLNFLFNMLKIVISFLMFCTDCKYYLIIWLFKVNSDDEKNKIGPNESDCLPPSRNEKWNQFVIRLHLTVETWSIGIDFGMFVKFNSLPFPSLEFSWKWREYDEKKNIVDSTYHWYVLLVWQVNMKLFGNFVSLSNQKKRSRREPNIWKNFLSIKSTKCRLLLSITIKVILLVFCCVCVCVSSG